MIDPARTFEALVEWIHDELIVRRGAPGLVVGISGTDSIVAFLACARAFELAGRPDRVVGIHFGEAMPPPEEVEASPLLRAQFWFQREVIPWLREKAPGARILVDGSVDPRADGLRWGALMDWSVIADPRTKALRAPSDRYWVVGTRNATEEALLTYSNASTMASVQVLTRLWKSEILRISEHLGAPKGAIARSCDVDCVCGRFQLPAAHIPEVDALLMVRQGKLAPSYVEEQIPGGLRAELEAFIETQIASADFKKRIPYVADESVARVADGADRDAVDAARAALAGPKLDPRPLSRLVPRVVARGLADVATELAVVPSGDRKAWFPEALALFGTPGLRLSQKTRMIEEVYGARDLPVMDVARLASCSQRIGNYAFGFPQWRHLTQRSGAQPALAELFGMRRLSRASDLRDPSLPPSDPARDELGTGFAWQDGDWHIEYRRAYLVCSRRSGGAPVTLVIRNSSYHFGRDRLPEAAYVSFDPLEPEALQALTPEWLERSGRFIPWQDVARAEGGVPLAERLKRSLAALDRLDRFNREVSEWLRAGGEGGGRAAFAAFLRERAARLAEGGAPVFLAVVEGSASSWAPRSARRVTPELAREIERARDAAEVSALFDGIDAGHRLVMMSGEAGDLP